MPPGKPGRFKAWIDRANNSPALTVVAPPTLTTQVPNCPAGTYYQPPRDLTVNLTVKRTEIAVANGWRFGCAVQVNAGIFDSNSCTVSVRGEVHGQGASVSQIAGALAGATLPRIVWNQSENPTGGDYYAFPGPGPFSVDNVLTGILVIPAGGLQVLTLTNTNNYTFANGQRLRIANGAGAAQGLTQQISLAATGAGMSLTRNRTLYYGGDYIDLEWDGRQGVWVEAGYCTRQQLILTGSASYDAPSLAAGASTTTTVTVTGAALGDFVSAVSLGIDAAGVDLSGYVSAADTVTVILRNSTGSAVNLAATTLTAMVSRK